MKNYIINLQFLVKAENESEAKDLGTGCYEHLRDTFNDNESLSQFYILKVEKENKKC